MRRCIVHFGMNKTGSSSIQATLYNGALDPGFHYVDVGVDNPTGPLLDGFMSPKRRYNEIKRRSHKITIERVRHRRNLVIKKLRSQFETTAAPNIILSAEGLWRLKPNELSSLYQFIQPYVDKVEAVAYVRPPKGFIESNFQQLVKGGADEFDLARFYPEYRERFEKFDEIFGAANVQYWRFSPQHFPKKCVVSDFCSRLGISADVDVQRVNEGLSRSATAALFSYRKFYDRFPERDRFNRENDLLVKKMYELPGEKLRFSSKLIGPILDARQDDIRWMESRLQAPLVEDISKHDDFAVNREEDLLSFDRATVDWLTAQAGADSPDGTQSLPEQVSALVHQLRIKLASEDTAPPPARVAKEEKNVNIKKFVRKVQKASPKLKGQLSEKETASLVRGVFSQIVHELDGVESGSITISGLGTFSVRETAGGKAKPQKRIVFTP